MAISATGLRANIYRLIDEVLETGRPLEVERGGRTVVIAPKEPSSVWERLPQQGSFIAGDPDDLVQVDWSSEWNPDPA